MDYVPVVERLETQLGSLLKDSLELSEVNNDILKKVFQLHDVFTNFTKDVIETILVEDNDQLCCYYNRLINRLTRLSDNLGFANEYDNFETFDFPFKFTKKLKGDSFVAVDVGGTLSKLVYTTSKPLPANYSTCLDLYNKSCKATYSLQFLINKLICKNDEMTGWNGRLYNFPSLSLFNSLKIELLKIKLEDNKYIAFKIFKNHEIDEVCQFIKNNVDNVDKIYITGGKSLDYTDKFREITGINVEYVNEVESVPKGVEFLINIERSLFTLNTNFNSIVDAKLSKKEGILVANFGSGTSFIRIDNTKSLRVNGSTIGGGSIMGVLHRITNQSDLFYLQVSTECVYNHDLLKRNRKLTTSINSNALENIEMIYRDLGKFTSLLSKQQGLKHCLFTGLGVLDSIFPLHVITSKLPDESLIFSHHGGFVGCFGCLSELL